VRLMVKNTDNVSAIVFVLILFSGIHAGTRVVFVRFQAQDCVYTWGLFVRIP
jgi:hypothetical protein